MGNKCFVVKELIKKVGASEVFCSPPCVSRTGPFHNLSCVGYLDFTSSSRLPVGSGEGVKVYLETKLAEYFDLVERINEANRKNRKRGISLSVQEIDGRRIIYSS